MMKQSNIQNQSQKELLKYFNHFKQDFKIKRVLKS